MVILQFSGFYCMVRGSYSEGGMRGSASASSPCRLGFFGSGLRCKRPGMCALLSEAGQSRAVWFEAEIFKSGRWYVLKGRIVHSSLALTSAPKSQDFPIHASYGPISPQSFQKSLIKECALNHMGILNMI